MTNDAYQSLENVIEAIKEDIVYELKEIKQDDAIKIDDFSDKVFEAIDTEISSLSRSEQFAIIDHFGGEDTIDKGLVDDSDFDRQIATTAWAILEQEVYSNSEIIELAEKLRYSVDYEEAQELIQELEA